MPAVFVRGAGDTWPRADPHWSLCRPHGKSYLYFTQFKAEVRGAEIEYGMAYVSTGRVGVRALGDGQDEDRDSGHLEGDSVIWKNMGHCADPQTQWRRGSTHRRALLAGQKADTLMFLSYCLSATCWESHMRAGAWELGLGQAQGQLRLAVRGGPQPLAPWPWGSQPGQYLWPHS